MTNRGQLQTVCDSGSLWNFTCSPGWTDEDVRVLRVAIMKYGCGNWKKIARHFPNKTNGQLNLQTQRLFGQQSTAEFFMLHVDPNPIRQINNKKVGVLRKNDCVVNTGKRLTKKEKLQMIDRNRKKWELPELEYKALEVPIRFDPEPPIKSIHDKVKKLSEVYRTMKSLNIRERQIKTLLNDPDWAQEKKNVSEMRKRIRDRLADIRLKSLSNSPQKPKRKKLSKNSNSNNNNNSKNNDDGYTGDDDIDMKDNSNNSNNSDGSDIESILIKNSTDIKKNKPSSSSKKTKKKKKSRKRQSNQNSLDDCWKPKQKVMKKM